MHTAAISKRCPRRRMSTRLDDLKSSMTCILFKALIRYTRQSACTYTLWQSHTIDESYASKHMYSYAFDKVISAAGCEDHRNDQAHTVQAVHTCMKRLIDQRLAQPYEHHHNVRIVDVLAGI